jgi:hypothetical protein
MNTEDYTVVNGLLGVLYLAILVAIVWLAYYFMKTMIKKK